MSFEEFSQSRAIDSAKLVLLRSAIDEPVAEHSLETGSRISAELDLQLYDFDAIFVYQEIDHGYDRIFFTSYLTVEEDREIDQMLERGQKLEACEKMMAFLSDRTVHSRSQQDNQVAILLALMDPQSDLYFARQELQVQGQYCWTTDEVWGDTIYDRLVDTQDD